MKITENRLKLSYDVLNTNASSSPEKNSISEQIIFVLIMWQDHTATSPQFTATYHTGKKGTQGTL